MRLLTLLCTSLAITFAQSNPGLRGHGDLARYAVVLQDAPVAVQHPGRVASATAEAKVTRTRLAASQQNLSARIEKLGGRVMSSEQDLVNAIFILASPAQAEAMRALPGVQRVERLRPMKLLANRALDLVNARGGWARITGGEANAGAGVRIGIIDSGIDHQHPAFQDSSLTAPAGFPRCGPAEIGDCANWTNSKVIVARSYVNLLNFQFGTRPSDTRPDDVTPRDRVGHGTMAAMMAAGVRVPASGVFLSGVAPKAYLGNYKIFGSPGVNESTYPNAIIAALNDARADGMDIVTLSLGSPAFWPAVERFCTDQPNSICDIQADAIQNATLGTSASPGITVVVAAGNDGDVTFNYPALGTVQSPGTAPGAITVGATTNSHVWFQTLTVPGATLSSSGLPSSSANVRLGNGPQLARTLSAPLRDTTPLDDDRSGRVCRPLANGSLTGTLAVIRRGNCTFAEKVNFAAAAGAVGVILEQTDGNDFVFRANGLEDTAIPLAVIGSTAGKALRAYLAANPDRVGTIDPAFREVSDKADEIAGFSSQGPAIGDGANNKDTDFLIKPEVVAPGTDLLMATQSYDPNSSLYSPTGFQVAQGTSFAVPIVAGTAALVKQRNRALTPQQIKSAVVNSADLSGLVDFNNNNREVPARVTAAGAGKLNVSNALNTNFSVEPATLPFGVVRQGTTLNRGLVIRNTTNGPLTLSIEFQPVENTTMSLTALLNGAPVTNFTMNPAGSTQLSLRLSGTQPPPGSYSGFVRISQQNAQSTTLRIPYLFLVGDGVPYNIVPLAGDGFFLTPGFETDFRLKVLDRFGVPVIDASTTRRITSGPAAFTFATLNTDRFGVVEGRVIMNGVGPVAFEVAAGNLKYEFTGTSRAQPVAALSGVTNAASNQSATATQGFAPGSYISIFGTALSDTLKVFATPYLPISLAGVSVSFDSEANRISVPGRLHFVSPSQVNVQIPWEVQGLTTVSMKVSLGERQSGVIQLPISNQSPAFFEYTEANGQRSVAALDGDFRVVGANNPVRRGAALQIYLNGLGAVDNRPASGEVSPSQPLATTRVQPVVTIGGRPAQVIFSGLAPGNVGLYQVNVILPADTPTGRQPVTCTVNGADAPGTFVTVQ
ncbi:MAG: S8 family serine peptidase [Bryobacteraceae bacterium]|nr:S8 family serine peptidase [Bryobacteraceae bacterium]